MVNIYPGPEEGGLQIICIPIYFIRVTIYPAVLPHNISRGHYLPTVTGRVFLQLIYQPINCIRVIIHPTALPHNISRGHFLPRGREEGACS
jgi:hypothetical protein